MRIVYAMCTAEIKRFSFILKGFPYKWPCLSLYVCFFFCDLIALDVVIFLLRIVYFSLFGHFMKQGVTLSLIFPVHNCSYVFFLVHSFFSFALKFRCHSMEKARPGSFSVSRQVIHCGTLCSVTIEVLCERWVCICTCEKSFERHVYYLCTLQIVRTVYYELKRR